MAATKQSWKHLPAPAQRESLEFAKEFSKTEAEQIKLGLIPEAMEDKWFVYFEDDWLRFHRSWTGAHIYSLRLDRSGDGLHVVEAWANRDPAEHKGTDPRFDVKLLHFLIDAFLLKKADAKFPMPSDFAEAPEGVVQHHYVGRGYPEVKEDGT